MQSMQSAVDDFERELEPLVRAQAIAEWDSAIDASDEHEHRLVDASKRVDAVLTRARAATRSSSRPTARAAPRASSPGASGSRGSRARPRSATGCSRIASSRPRPISGRCSRATAGSFAVARSTTTRSPRCCASPSDRAERREAWDASKSIGPHAAPLVRELAHLRNEAARALGYRDHFEFSLTLDELDEAWLLSLLDDLEGRLSATWERTKAEIDAGQRARLGLAPDEPLQPWDFADAFFQDAPTASDDPLEAALAHLDPVGRRPHVLRGARRRRRRRARR